VLNHPRDSALTRIGQQRNVLEAKELEDFQVTGALMLCIVYDDAAALFAWCSNSECMLLLVLHIVSGAAGR
jgi:hypothetical protein